MKTEGIQDLLELTRKGTTKDAFQMIFNERSSPVSKRGALGQKVYIGPQSKGAKLWPSVNGTSFQNYKKNTIRQGHDAKLFTSYSPVPRSDSIFVPYSNQAYRPVLSRHAMTTAPTPDRSSNIEHHSSQHNPYSRNAQLQVARSWDERN